MLVTELLGSWPQFLIAVIVNCSGSGWREHGEIMWHSVDSIWGDISIT